MFRPATRNHSFEWMGENYAPLIDTDHFMGRSLLGQKRRNMPAANIQRDENLEEMEVAVPGFDKEFLEISVEDDHAWKIVRTAQLPVLILQKALPKPFAFKTIVFASGLEPDTHEALNRLLQFADKVGAENLHFIEVTTPHNFKPTCQVLKDMEVFIASHNFKNIRLHNYNHYTVEAGIVEFAESVNADLVAIANHGRTDLSSLFIESIPENLVKQAAFPVLSIRV